jgi:hypothetical protein
MDGAMFVALRLAAAWAMRYRIAILDRAFPAQFPAFNCSTMNTPGALLHLDSFTLSIEQYNTKERAHV